MSGSEIERHSSAPKGGREKKVGSKIKKGPKPGSREENTKELWMIR